MSDETEFDPTKFDYEKATRWIGSWVITIDDPTLTWAWEATYGTIDAYAVAGFSPKNTMRANRAELWHDWFMSWSGGDAHYGVHGVMQEFAHACPEEAVNQQLVTVNEAFDIGKGNKLLPRRSKSKAPAEKTTLRVVVDNTATKRTP